MNNLVGKIAKRYTFCLQERTSREYIYLVSFIDVLLPDMEDYIESLDKAKPTLFRNEKINSKKNDKVYLCIDYFSITQEFLDHPENHFEIDGDKIKFHHQIERKLNHHITIDLDKQQIGLHDIFPKHDCLTYLDFWQDKLKTIDETYGKDDVVLTQLSELSNQHLHFDLSLTSDVLGNLYILHYNPYIKNIHVRYNDNPKGIYLRSSFRLGKETKLQYFFCNKQSDNVIYEIQYNIIEPAKKYHFIPLNDIVDKTSLYIWDENNDLVFVAENMSFIMSVSLNLNVKAFNVKLNDGKILEKYEPSQLKITDYGEKEDFFSIANNTALYNQLEKQLVFIFFDGSNKTRNVLKAQEFIGKILNSAHDRLYICDPYFDINVLKNYVFDVKNVRVNIKIIMEKTWKDITEAKKIWAAINAYNGVEQLSSISCRVLKGECSLHDRYIVADDAVWLLGTSLNNIGNKVSTIIKIPSAAAKNVISSLENLWLRKNSDTLDRRIKRIELSKKRCRLKKWLLKKKYKLHLKLRKIF